MCGICGKLNFDRHQPVDPELMGRMMKVLHHRGPDGSGEFRKGPVGLGHRRLSIIDLNTGDQPMSNEDGTVWIVYNGEIYNYLDLRADLLKRGHKFKSASDTEIIIHLYEDLGPEAIAKLRGMFAFAIWDEPRQTLILARDRVGIKPLYYTNTGKSLIFASEIKSILKEPSFERNINLSAIDRFLTFYYLPGNETLLQGIYKLEPGHYLIAQNGLIDVKQYWDLRFENSPRWGKYELAVEALRELLIRSVKDHLISDVPVGVLLSGGVDSTGILRYAVEQSDRPIHTFTIGFAERAFADERPYARLAARRYGTKHQEITMTAEDFRDFLPKYVLHMEEPVCEPPAVALYFVSHLAQQSSVKVLLSGEGGDEAFGGYPNYRNLLMLEHLKAAFGSAKGLVRSALQTLDRIGLKRVGRYGNLVNSPLHEYYLSRTNRPDIGFNPIKEVLYTKDFTAALGTFKPEEQVKRLFKHLDDRSLLSSMLYVDTKTWLPDDLLVKADKITMATSVELRVPLLDHQVLEFAASLPDHYKVWGWSTKRVLKSALKESVPREILNRKKTGFPVPYNSWLCSEMRDYVFETVLGRKSSLCLYFSEDKVHELLRINMQTMAYSKEIFCLLILALWHRAFIG